MLSPNRGKYGPEKSPSLDTFHAVIDLKFPWLIDPFIRNFGCRLNL